MPASLSPSTHLFGGSQKFKRPRAFSVTVCGKDRKASFSNDEGTSNSVGDSSSFKAGNAPESEKSRYLKKGTVLVEENADGSVLFQFEPSSRLSQSANMPAVVTPGKQRKSRPKRPPAPEPGSSTLLGQDTAYSMSWADRKDERKVPCYLWHESGLPKRVNLRDFPTQTSDDADEAVSSSDAPSTIADSGSAFSQDGSSSAASPSAAGRAIHKAWEPVRQVLLRVWRLLPYWFRKMLIRSQEPHVPPVHASKVLAQHAMSYQQREPVEGSTYDLTTGRSPTPLVDLERYQIEMLVDMGISDVELYRVALTAPSAVTTDQIVASSFDRLEFLGDSVVGLVFRSWVYNRFPKDDEGSMTNTANTLVSNRAHVQYANQLHLTSYIAQNLKYLRPTARVDEDVIADAFEALVGAIYLDRGLQAASTFVITLAEEVMGLERDLSSYRNYKLYLVNNVNHADLGRVSYVSKKRGNLWQSKPW
ncbi:hypothetical protein WJX82_002912 [Trebouxia sp. C0006]